ncbi:hypothetical protein MRB53_012646 [Persea americana]|uniref:Uncharacterized protein n=1 Tax=Persea americana TaxID=3435 RepID=A0ACC2LY60_PERAE|nr:hypothetical protein MRB53_012646 [Persea americana]
METYGGNPDPYKSSSIGGDTPGFSVYKMKLAKIDNEIRVREEELVEGEYLDVGFLLYRVRFDFFEKEDDSSIIRSTIEYELAEESVIYASLVSINSIAIIAEVAGKHLTEDSGGGEVSIRIIGAAEQEHLRSELAMGQGEAMGQLGRGLRHIVAFIGIRREFAAREFRWGGVEWRG